MSNPEQQFFFAEKKGAEMNRERTFRYKLWRIWDANKPLIMFVGCNPSIADAAENDNTVRRCIRFATDWGYGGFYIVNLYAFIATKPADLKKKLVTSTPEQIRAMNEINDEYIKEAAIECDRIVFVWGAVGGKFAKRCSELSMMFNNQAWCIRTTKEGHPEHPLYLPADLQLIRFN